MAYGRDRSARTDKAAKSTRDSKGAKTAMKVKHDKVTGINYLPRSVHDQQAARDFSHDQFMIIIGNVAP